MKCLVNVVVYKTGDEYDLRLCIPWVFPDGSGESRCAHFPSADSLNLRLYEAQIATEAAKLLKKNADEALADPGLTVPGPHVELSYEQLRFLGFGPVGGSPRI